MTRMARRLKAALASVLAAALVLLSPGFEAPRLFAQVIGRAAPIEGIRAVPGMTGGAVAAAPAFAPALTASALAAPAAASMAAPAAAAPALSPAAAPAASVPAMAKALAPHIEAAAKAQTSASGAASAGRNIEDVITGGKSAGAGEISDVAGSFNAGAPSLGFSAAASAPSEAPKSGVPAAAAPAEGKTVASETSYRVHRFLLKTIAALTGAVNSLPAAGPALTQTLIARAADKTVVLSDYDDTLAGYNQVLPEDMVSAIQAVKAAGKDFVVISDRGDEKRAHQLTVFESLASLPVSTRAGMYLAANSGGRVYRYDEKGEPVRVFEAPALDEASKAKVAEAAEATKARLKEIGAEQHFPSEGNNNPSESWGTYGYALMLKVGSSNEAVKGAAAILQEELGKRGLDVEVNPRFAKDPANPPYINFSIVTKAGSAAYIAKALKAEPKDVLVIGDSMYAPHDAAKAGWLARWGETLSGREMPRTGNRTDANMEKGVPGALTLSVGTTGDPRSSNLWVLAGKGPSVTREVLMSVASKTRAQSRPKAGVSENAVAVGVAVAIVAAAAAGYYAMFHAFADIVRLGEQSISQHGRDLLDGGLMFGGTLGLFGWRSKPGDDTASRYAALENEYRARFMALPGVAAVKVEDNDFYYGGTLNDTDGKIVTVVFASVDAFQKGRGELPATLPALEGIKDVLRYNVKAEVEAGALSAAYEALEQSHIRSLSGAPGAVSFRVKDGWNPYGGDDNRASGKDIEVVFTGLQAYQAAVAALPKTLPAIDGVADVSRYNVVPVLEKKAKAAAYAAVENGYKARLGAIPGVLSVRVKDSFNPYSGDDNRVSGKDVEVVFDGVTSLQAAQENGLLPKDLPALAGLADVAKYRVEGLVAPAERTRLKRILAGAGLFALTAAIYGGFYYAASHAPAAYSGPVAPGGWEMLFGGTLAGLGFGSGRKKAAAATGPTLKRSISPASPVDGFETFVYAAALDAVRGLAAEHGYRPDNLRLSAAALTPRAWGEDWTFTFVSPREHLELGPGPRAYEVKVRRTMVSETQVDAYGLKDLGPVRLFAGFPAQLVSETIKVSPMAAVAKSGDDARTLDLEARWSAAGPAELVYVIRGEKGRELKSINAATGAETVPQPWEKAKAAAIWLGLAAATVGIYAALYYAINHAPAASSAFQVPQGWQGPIPGNVDIGAVFGGMLSVVGLSGVIKRVKGKAPTITDERVRAAANSAIASKGRPWSQTEYNMSYYMALESLKKDGATPAQIALFEKLCADAPIRGGSFNPWSGD